MLNAEGVIKNLTEIKEFCDGQYFCQKCPFYGKDSDHSPCQILSSVINDIDDYAVIPAYWDLEGLRIDYGK